MRSSTTAARPRPIWWSWPAFSSELRFPADFTNRVVNIHPGLIPAFCGQGFYGHRVHQAVLDYGAKISGCTVHFADNDYDHGPVILQRAVPVLDDDTAKTLAARVFQAECAAYPEAIQLIADGRVRVEGRKVRITASSSGHCPIFTLNSNVSSPRFTVTVAFSPIFDQATAKPSSAGWRPACR